MVTGAVRSGGADHRGVPVQRVSLKPPKWQIGQLPLLVCDGIPHAKPGRRVLVLVLICSERKVLLDGCCWLICSERKVVLTGG
jgi:hypothetical protein